jgi:KUP system potassium uptake protein
MSKVKNGIMGLSLGALGVVFGDIGTSPLYAVQAIFGSGGQHLAINETNVYGIISLVIWSITIVVTIKFLSFIMRADNQGEGGIIALVGLIKGSKLASKYKWFFIILGLIGVAFFYGDSVITPAISVLSAVEGLGVVAPSLNSLVVPITLIVLTFLFYIQRYGTTWLGRLFGPIMFVWFLTIAIGGASQIMQHPKILVALSPIRAVDFFVAQPLVAFVSLAAVMLAVTGAEALYADMGHFGRAPIARAWLFLVFPALILCYMGQGALLLLDLNSSASPFFLLFPEILRIPVILLATLATLIASQAVISGAFSLTRQAVHLDFLPKMIIRHTSDDKSGQVYVPFVNLLLLVSVIAITVFFGSSAKLANAFGLAVSVTLFIDTILFIVIARIIWKKSLAYIAMIVACFLIIDLLFVASSITKFMKGGWLPLGIASIILLLISTWIKGQRIVAKERKSKEGNLQSFITNIPNIRPPIARVPGTAVYISHHDGFTPMALHATIEKLHEMHEKVVIVYVKITETAHIDESERIEFDDLGVDDGISCLRLKYGYHDSQNIPNALKAARHLSPELNFDTNDVSYFVSMIKIAPTKKRNLSSWRKNLYRLMSNNALSSSDYYKLPVERTVEIRSLLSL